jgi:hypothetical protein
LIRPSLRMRCSPTGTDRDARPLVYTPETQTRAAEERKRLTALNSEVVLLRATVKGRFRRRRRRRSEIHKREAGFAPSICATGRADGSPWHGHETARQTRESIGRGGAQRASAIPRHFAASAGRVSSGDASLVIGGAPAAHLQIQRKPRLTKGERGVGRLNDTRASVRSHRTLFPSDYPPQSLHGTPCCCRG